MSYILEENIRKLATDANGNVYGISALAAFNQTLDTSYKYQGFGFDDFCVFSLRCDGSLRWVRYYGTPIDDLPGGISVSPNGDVYVFGHVTVGGSHNSWFGDTMLYQTSNMYKSAFIAKLDSNGSTQWLNFPGPLFSNTWARFMQVETGTDDIINVLTWFYDSVTWNGFSIPARGRYILRFEKDSGNLIGVTYLDFKAKYWGDDFEVFTLDTDNNIYMTLVEGVGNDTLVIGTDTLFYESGKTKTVLARFNAQGHRVWHKVVSGTLSSTSATDCHQIVSRKPVIINDNVYVLGETQSYPNSNFLGVPIQNTLADYPHIRTQLIASFNKSTGSLNKVNYFKAKNIIIPGALHSFNNNLYVSMAGGVLVVLNQNDTIIPYYTGSYLQCYPFIAEIDTGLTHFNWGVATRSTMYNVRQYVYTMTADNNGNLYIGGSTEGPLTNSAGDTIPGIGGNSDFFVAKIATTNTNCGCKKSDPKPEFVSLYDKALMVKGSTTVGADSLYWIWGDGDSTKYTQQNTNAMHIYQTGGSYTVCLRAWNICGVSDSCIQVAGVGMEQQQKGNESLLIYPNPFTQELSVVLPPGMENATLTLYDISGRQVLQSRQHSQSGNISVLNTGNLEKGVYILRILSPNGSAFSGRVVRE